MISHKITTILNKVFQVLPGVLRRRHQALVNRNRQSHRKTINSLLGVRYMLHDDEMYAVHPIDMNAIIVACRRIIDEKKRYLSGKAYRGTFFVLLLVSACIGTIVTSDEFLPHYYVVLVLSAFLLGVVLYRSYMLVNVYGDLDTKNIDYAELDSMTEIVHQYHKDCIMAIHQDYDQYIAIIDNLSTYAPRMQPEAMVEIKRAIALHLIAQKKERESIMNETTDKTLTSKTLYRR